MNSLVHAFVVSRVDYWNYVLVDWQASACAEFCNMSCRW